MEQASEGRPRRAQLMTVAILLAASMLLSRVLGYVRDAVLAWRIGATVEADAYFAAFMLPDMLNYFLAGGALSVAFIPFYTKLRSDSGAEAAARFFSVVLGTLGALTVLATLLLWWRADALVALQFPRFAPDAQALTARLTRILLPAQIFFVVGGVVRGALMAHGRFATQALAPVLYNLGIIVGGVALGGVMGAEGFAWGALVGAVVGPFLAPLLEAARSGELKVRMCVAPLDRIFLRYLLIALPLILGVSLLTVDEWYDRWFGALLAPGTVAHLAYARRLMLLPVAIVGQAIATAALPLLAHLWSEGRRDEMNRTLLETLRAGLGLSLLASGAFFVFAEPLVTLLFERGRFAAEDTVRVVALLRIFAFAVPAWIVQQIAVRAFYARGDTWRPMLLASAIAVPAAALYWLFGARYGPAGLAAAGVIGMSASALATLFLARRLHGGPPLRPLFETLLRAAGATAFAGFVAQVGAMWLRLPGTGAVGALLVLASGGALYAVAAFAVLHVVGDPPLRAALQRVLRLGRRRGA